MRPGASIGITATLCLLVIVLGVAEASPVAKPILQPPSYTAHAPIVIGTNVGFVSAEGVTGGTGTGSDPYIIQGWNISASSGTGITILATTADFVIQDVNIYSSARGIYFQNVTYGAVSSALLTDDQSPVVIDHSSHVLLNSTTISNTAVVSQSAITVTNSTHVSISSGAISGSISSAVSVSYSSQVDVFGNQISSFVYGLNAAYSTMVTIMRNKMSTAEVKFDQSGNSTVSSNNVTGILADDSVTISILDNTIGRGGVDITTSTYTTISGNAFLGSGLKLGAQPMTQNILPNNTVNGKPLVSVKNCVGTTVDGIPVGELVAVGCQGLRISNLQITNTTDAILLADVRGALLLNNRVSNNTLDGIVIESSSYLTIAGNTATYNANGLSFVKILDPQVQNEQSSYVTVENNNFTKNQYGIFGLDTVSNVSVYHNNFINNAAQANGFGNLLLDNGYPSGGNYWSDYAGVDNCSGPQQNVCPNPDGIGDTSYAPDSGLKDRYPLMKPYSLPSDSSPPAWTAGSTITTSDINSMSVTLSWPAATDDVEVMSYRIYQGPTIVAYVPGQYHSYTITGLNPGTTYTFNVQAGDPSDKWTPTGLSATVTTTNPVLVEILAVSIAAIGTAVVLGYVLYRNRKRHKTPAVNPGSG